jgi:tetraacyldisaccharide 4'-kinase
LREAPARLARVDAVVLNGQPRVAFPALPQATFTMHLRAGAFVNLRDPGIRAEAARFRDRPVHAVAGIGHPQRFFASLAELGIDAIPHAFPDHHAYVPADLPPGTVLMTEKDAVKCAAFGRDDLWALGVDACVDEGLQSLITERLKTLHGQQTA